MEIPVFRLEGIVKTTDETTDFEGPLELILHLLSKNKIEIRDISISLILEQYQEFLEEMAELDLYIASEFVAMASHLTYIKTKMMLSRDEEVTELEQLIASLEQLQWSDVYLRIKSVAQTLSGMYAQNGVMIAGPPEYWVPDAEYRYIHESNDLLEAIYRVVGRDNALVGSINQQEAAYPRRIAFSIPEKIVEIIETLKQHGSMSVIELLYKSGSRPELIATLIAILELCRVGSALLTVGQEEVTISYMGSGRTPDAISLAEIST
ncbi:MAG: segregation/condensation protein A [Oscillospiraceae bacterium]|nr:segregation/condensation protein A [Oscillospiraceae bacterium]